MTDNPKTKFIINREEKMITVEREFKAPVSIVWKAWTDKSLADQWSAPRPWKAETKVRDFRVGGYWLYAMKGPNGEEAWSRDDFRSIKPQENICFQDAFSDADGNINNDLPLASWNVTFKDLNTSTLVLVNIEYANLSDLDKIIEMRFREGFIMTLDNLDELLVKLN